MKTHHVETATVADQAAVHATLTLAFGSDPMARWSWPDPHTHLMAFPRLATAFAAQAFARGTAYRIGGFAGAALWLPPDLQPDEEALGALMQETVPAEIQADAGQVMEQMGALHPTEPHWYLPLIGVDPAQRGKGLGDALMAHALAIVDSDGLPAYLESTNPRNISLYERHGFEQLGRIQVGASPVMTPMLRKPRRK
jgi:ribosomal protein S18 acetylase RimI-like enzyme